MGNMSHFPKGFNNGVVVRGLPLLQAFSGQIFYVSNASTLLTNQSNGSDSNDGAFNHPFATIDRAVNACTASRGDIIMVKAGHSETISSATALALDVAGIAIIGLGVGTSRPKIILDTAITTTIAVSAANITMSNIVFSANFADITQLFTVTAAEFSCENSKFTQEAVDMNFVDIATTDTVDNSCDGMTFIKCNWVEVDTAAASLVNVNGDLDRLTVLDCYIDLGVNGVLSTIAEVAAGKDLTNLDVRRNYSSRLVTASAVQLITFVDTTTTNTGIMEGNRCRSLDIAGELIVTAGTNISFYDNLTTSVIDKSGYILPVIDA